MKGFGIFLAVGLAASTEAARLPLCSAVCLTDAIVATGCNAVSTECICRSDVFMPSVTECVEKSCPEDDKLSTLEAAEQFCSATSLHDQLKKRWSPSDSSSNGWDAVKSSTTTPATTTTKPATTTTTPATTTATQPASPATGRWQGLKSWWGSGFFGGFGGFGGRRNRPHWGWAPPSRTTTVTASASQPTSTPKPVEWVPNFKSGTNEWWKQQSAEWWAANGYDWWRANGWHFSGPQWYWGKSEQWWQTQGNRWWQGPSDRNRGNWRGGRPWWPSAPAVTQPEPVKPTATPTYTPPDNQAWEDWPGWPSTWPDNNNPTGPTPTADPTNQDGQGWQGWTPSRPTATPSSPQQTQTRPTWVPYTTTKPVQTVIPTGSGW